MAVMRYLRIGNDRYEIADEKLKVSEITSGITYYPILGSGMANTTSSRQWDSTGLQYDSFEGEEEGEGGNASLSLGNYIPVGETGSKRGSLILYGEEGSYSVLQSSTTGEGTGYYILLPNKQGTVALTDDIPTNVSQLKNDLNFITDYTETDPTVPAWAKATTKPTYTAQEVGAIGSVTVSRALVEGTKSATITVDGTSYDIYSKSGTITEIKTTAGAHTTIDVSSGAVSFNVPTKTSHLTNDSGFVTTDNKVLQSASTSTAWRKVLLHYTTNSSGGAVSTATNQVYAAIDVEVQPSTGTLAVGALTSAGIVIGDSFSMPGYDGDSAGFRMTSGSGGDNERDNMDMGWDWTSIAGAGAAFRSSKTGRTNAGQFVFFARTKDENENAVYTQLVGNPGATNNGGSLLWGGRRVVTATEATAVGSASLPVYVDADGHIQPVTAKSTANALIDSIDTATANWTDNTLIVTSDTTGDTNLYYRRPATHAWNYIKGKADTNYLKLTGGSVTGPTTFGDTVSIDDLNAGQLVVSGSASVANNLQISTINGHALSTAKDNNSIAVRTANGYLYASYLNQSSGAETPTTSSYIMYANSDGFLRKSTLANIKSILGLGSNAYTSTAYLPLAGGTMTGVLKATKPAQGIFAAAHYGGTGNTTKIKIKINSTTSWMLSFVVTLYQSYRATKVMISGYQYGSNYWYQPEARLIADSDGTETISVYFGYDSANNLWVGFDGGDYTGVAITDVVNGYTQITDYSDLFTISNVSAFGGTTQTTVTAASKANYANSAGSAGSASSATVATRLAAFSSASTSMTWGNQTGTVLGCYATTSGGGLGFRDNNPASGQVSMTIDGTVYIKEGAVNVGDAIKSITRSGTTFTYTTLWGNTGTFTQQDNNTTYSAGTGLSLSGTTFSISNGGVSPYEANLQWGGKNFAGGYGCIDAAMIADLGANRFMFAKEAGITIEYSRDGGSTWTDYGNTGANKVSLFATGSVAYGIGKHDSTNKATANTNKYQLRVTLSTHDAEIYSAINKFAFYVSTNGSNSSTVTIQKALESTPTTYVNVVSDVALSGWSGWNIINTESITTYGNTAGSQYGRLRFIFKANGGNTTYNGLTIYRICGFGGQGWTTPSNMAKTGHLYSYDNDQNATFPAQITATQFNGKATQVRDSSNGNAITITYGKAGQSSTSWLASWNGYELGSIKPENITAGNASKINGHSITVSTSGPSGGSNGDIWFTYTA